MEKKWSRDLVCHVELGRESEDYDSCLDLCMFRTRRLGKETYATLVLIEYYKKKERNVIL